MGLEQIVHVLSEAGTAGPVLSDTLPEGKQEISAVFVLEKKVDFIDIDPGVPAQCPVADDPVEHAVQHHQHPHRKKLLAQISDVIDTYVFRAIKGAAEFGTTTAIGLYQSVVGFILVMGSNWLAKKYDKDSALF